MSLLNTNIGPERVQVFDQPLGVVQVPGASTSVTAFLISTTQVGAPVNTPTRVTTLEDFETLFGGPDEVAYDAYYAVQGYFDNGGSGKTAIIVHVGTSPTANSFIGNASAGSGLRALDPIDDVSLVAVPGLPLEMAYLVQPALIDYSETVRTEYGATLSTLFSLLAVPRSIKKANTDVQLLSTSITSIAGLVLQLPTVSLANITPGMIVKKAGVFEAVITAVNDSLDQITVLSLGTLAASDAITIHNPSAVTYKESVINNPSRVAAWYFNNLQVTDRSSTANPGDLVAVDPVGHVAGVMGRIDANIAIGGVSHAPAGIKFAGLAGIVGLELTISERLDAEPLRLAFINRITSFPGSGNVIWGGYTAESGSSPVYTADEQLIQVMRSVQYIKASLEVGLRSFIWENFSPDTQAEVERAIEAFLANNIHLFPAGLPQSQQFRVLSVEPTQNELDQGLLKVRVQIKPNKAVRFIEVALEFPLPTA
jgi:phage tail sheath protein FI